MQSNSQFKKGSGVITCAICQRQTRETGKGEANYELCAQCIELSQMENRHSDHSHAGELWDCEDCVSDLTKAAKDHLDIYRKAQAGETEDENPLAVRRAEILKAIENRTYEYEQLPALIHELAEIDAKLSWTPAEILEREA